MAAGSSLAVIQVANGPKSESLFIIPVSKTRFVFSLRRVLNKLSLIYLSYL